MHYHLRNHNGNLSHECPDCDMKFLQKSVLELHIRSKHKSGDEKKAFVCPCCDYSDLRKGNCLIHFARIHLKSLTDKMKKKSNVEGQVVSCTECSKGFKNMTGFYYHLGTCVNLPQNNEYSESWSKLVC